MPNRKIAPEVSEITALRLPEPQIATLNNEIPVYLLEFPGQEMLKVEVVFKAGRNEELQRIAARATARLVREGSKMRNSAEIAEWMDYYGSAFVNPTNLDTANFVLYTLSKYQEGVIPVFAEAILEPAFPEFELSTFAENSIRELMVELEKVEVIAYRQLTENIFGKDHPYGYNSTPDDYRALTRQTLIQHHQTWFVPETCVLFISGGNTEKALQQLAPYLETLKRQSSTPQTPYKLPQPGKTHNQHLPHPISLQTAIKIGRKLFNRSHPDYNGMYVLNTILGGYFSSRLMLNIREKKGYTYNIYSTLDAMRYDGYFYIATEVNKDKANATIREIYKELKNLREKLVPEEEMEMVRSYLLGMLLNGLDGPLNSSDLLRTLVVDDTPLESFEALVHCIQTITPQQIQLLAQQYLQPEDLWSLTVG